MSCMAKDGRVFSGFENVFTVFQASVTFSGATQQQSEQALHGENTSCGLLYVQLPFNQSYHSIARSIPTAAWSEINASSSDLTLSSFFPAELMYGFVCDQTHHLQGFRLINFL